MKTAILEVSHNNLWLRPGFLLALEFREGWVCFRIKSREFSRLKPFSIGNIAAGGNLTAWNTIADTSNRRYLEPHAEDYLVHSFFGVDKPKCKIFLAHPSDVIRGTLKGIELNLTDDWGYIDGDSSPFGGPYALDSEIISVKERYPAIQAHNPLSGVMTNVLLSFDIYKYTYVILQDINLIRDILLNRRQARKYTIGRTEPSATTIPNWLQNKLPAGLLKQTLEIIAEGS